MQVKVEGKIIIELESGKKLELTLNEAKELKDKLKGIFNDNQIQWPYYVEKQIPTYDPWKPHVTWCGTDKTYHSKPF